VTIAAALGVAALVGASAALAASSPTISVGAATGITPTAATLHGSVNPNGLATTYQFQFGPTSALGRVAPATAASAGAGTAAVAEKIAATGLSPDTTYYFRLEATNSAGQSFSPTETFKTTGNPAPTVGAVTATGVTTNQAVLTGTINPNNQATSYWFDFGVTSLYGFNSFVKTIPAGTAPVTVSVTIPGLQPGIPFHYRLVASHGSTSTTYGPDGAFTTLPWPRPHTFLKGTVSPRSVRRSPAQFTVSGQLMLPATTPATLGCAGNVQISYYARGSLVFQGLAPVTPSCTYSASTRIGSLGRGRVRMSVKLRFRGNAWVAPSNKHLTVRVR